MGSVGKNIFGTLSDTLGRERSKFIADGIALLGILALAFIYLSIGPLAILFALCFGIGYGAAAPLIPAVTADIFMGSHFGMIFAIIGIGGGVGGAAGTYVSGWLRDVTGGYGASFTLSCVSLVLSSVLIYRAAPGKVRKMVKGIRIQNTGDRIQEEGQKGRKAEDIRTEFRRQETESRIK
jgi:MFS family permease